MVVHLHLGVLWGLAALWSSLQVTLLPYNGCREYWMGRVKVVWCLIQNSEVVAPAHVD
jgi:hypothetical protein